MARRFYILIVMAMLLMPSRSFAFAAQEDAENMAVLMAVMNYKIDDEEHIRNLDALREDARFNRRLQRMLDKLTNSRTKNSTNKKVLDILEKAGKDLKRVLD